MAEVGPHDVHEVFNAEDEPATSVHLYSPPLAAMGYHLGDETGGPVVIEGVPPRGGAVSGADAARALHPGRRRLTVALTSRSAARRLVEADDQVAGSSVESSRVAFST